eukprot:TRINITY_DN23262_c0_g1_i1.p1 TRINITY_DN23262_c0_g1~~TRINITY_DN23262_c0_g1_i1.p1  ORF type:complete len:144 (-),score=8.49 TRINITY_DN23262_c0_g1_i1:1157-1588(-)
MSDSRWLHHGVAEEAEVDPERFLKLRDHASPPSNPSAEAIVHRIKATHIQYQRVSEHLPSGSRARSCLSYFGRDCSGASWVVKPVKRNQAVNSASMVIARPSKSTNAHHRHERARSSTPNRASKRQHEPLEYHDQTETARFRE